MQLLLLASTISVLGSAYFWFMVYRKANHLLAPKANRLVCIGFLVGLLALLMTEEAHENMIYFIFFLGLSTATSFALSLFAEENQLQRWNVVFAQLLLLAAAAMSGIGLIFSF